MVQGNRTVPDVTGIFSEEMCGLNFTKFSDTDFGWWSIKMSSAPIVALDHFATFHINQLGSWPQDIRLPTDIKPTQYDLMLTPDLDPSSNFTTDGLVTIRLNTALEMKPSGISTVKLHIKQIIINESSVTVKDVSNNQNIPIMGHEYDLDREFYVIHLKDDLRPDSLYDVTIGFLAILNDDNDGFYRSSYTVQDGGSTSWLAATQFESTSARKSFPCMDEPAMKAIVATS